MVQVVSVVPGWNPLNSAGSGAAFAGLMAAITIAVSIQIVFATDPDQANRSHLRNSVTLVASAPTLVVLMLATYLYIMLDGVPSSSEEVVDSASLQSQLQLRFGSTDDPGFVGALAEVDQLGNGYSALAARGFAMAGTVLAFGALMTLFMVATAIEENKGGETARRWAAAVFFVATAVIMYILVYGYQTGVRAAEHREPGTRWWLAHIVAVGALPVAVAALPRAGDLYPRLTAGREQSLARLATGWRESAAFPVVGMLLATAVPAAAVVAEVSNGPEANLVSLNVASIGSAIYYGVGCAMLIAIYDGKRGAYRASSTVVRGTEVRPHSEPQIATHS